MRTIKFRGRVCGYDEDRYVYGDLIRKKGLRKTGIWQIVCNCAYFYVDPNSVAQLIGYDKNDTEIYEGDELVIDFKGAAKVIGDGFLISNIEASRPTAEAKLKIQYSHGRHNLFWRTHNGSVDTGIDWFLLEPIKAFIEVKEATTHGVEQRNIG